MRKSTSTSSSPIPGLLVNNWSEQAYTKLVLFHSIWPLALLLEYSISRNNSVNIHRKG